MSGIIKKISLLPFLLILLALLAPVNVSAQHAKCTIDGRVLDEAQLPVAYASVAIYDGNVPVTGVCTGDDGSFSLKIDRAKKEYRLAVEFIGYIKFEKTIVPDCPRIAAGSVILKEDAISLGEVVVSAKEVAQKSTIEHTTINASSNMVSGKGTAVDVLRASSSVNVSNDKISIRGNSNILVLIDGVPTTVSDLSAIPAANIKNIEIITSPDASHDAEGTGGIINIMSKKPKKEGVSYMLAANYGFNHFATGNASISCNKAKTSWLLSYNAKYEDDVINSTLDRNIKATGEKVFQTMRASRYTFNNNIAFGADFRIDPRNRLSVDVKAIIPRLNTDQNLRNAFSGAGVIRDEYRHNDVTWNRENIEASIGYTRIVKPDVSDVTIKGSVSKIWGHRPSYYSLDSMPVNRSKSGGSPFIPSLQADYKQKLKGALFSAGAKLTYRSNDIYHRFYVASDDGWEYSDGMSNDLLHTELIPALYAMFSSRIGNKLTYKVGLRGEFSSVTLDSRREALDERKNSFFFAPSLSGTYKLTENQDFSLLFSRRIGRPTYPQLNPYMSMVDATTYEQGNIYLHPEVSTKFELGYNMRGEYFSLFANGYLNYVNDYISQITTLSDGRLVTTYMNADYDFKSGVDLSLKITPTDKVNLSIGTNVFHVSTEGMYNGADIDNGGWTNSSTFMFDLIPWQRADLQLQYFVTTPQYYPQLTTSFSHQMNFGFKQRLHNESLALSLLVTDVWNTARWKISSRNKVFDLTNVSRNKSRMLWVGVSYNFNSYKQKGASKSETDKNLIKFGL